MFREKLERIVFGLTTRQLQQVPRDGSSDGICTGDVPLIARRPDWNRAINAQELRKFPTRANLPASVAAHMGICPGIQQSRVGELK